MDEKDLDLGNIFPPLPEDKCTTEVEKLEERIKEDMETFVRVGMKFFSFVDVMCDKEDNVVGFVFTDYNAICKALSLIDINVVMDSDKEARKVKDRVAQLLDELLAGAVDHIPPSQEEAKQELIDETNIIKEDIEEL